MGYKYRQIYMNFWNKELPDELNQIAAIQEQLQKPGQEVITGHMSKYGPRDHGAEDPVRTLKLLLQEPSLAGPTQSGESTETAAENMYNAPPTFGHVHKMQGGSDFEDLVTSTNSLESGEDHPQAPPETVAKSEATMQLLIALITIIIVLNLLIYGTFLLRQRRRRAKALPFPAPKLGGTILSYDGANDEELKRCSKSRDGDDSFVLEMTRKSNTYEAIKTGQRSLSCSTVDTHTKVCEWMSSQEAPKSGSFNTATPPPQPILSDGRLIICQDIEVADAALLIPQHMHEPQHYEMLLQRQHSALTEPSDEILQQQYPLRNHSHSHSDPVDMILAADEQVTSFVHADDVDINVTSRDDSDGLEVIPLTSAQQLELLRQRNYPKVLPTEQDLINSSYKRNSLPPQNLNAPLPPPRTISNTLGRRRRDSSNITTSPLQVARDCGGEDEDLKEPQITQNTLIVGPIVPKSPASSLKRVKRMPESSAMTALSGSFQSFEAVPPAHETTPPQGGERTECIYAIRPSPGSCSWAAPNGDLYAQPMKSSSRNSLIPRPTKPAESQSQATPAGPAGESLGSTGMATASRIPQLQRQASGKDLQARTATDNTANPLGCQPRTDSTISSGSSASYASTTDSSSSSSTGTVRTELQQFQPAPGRSITTNI